MSLLRIADGEIDLLSGALHRAGRRSVLGAASCRALAALRDAPHGLHLVELQERVWGTSANPAEAELWVRRFQRELGEASLHFDGVRVRWGGVQTARPDGVTALGWLLLPGVSLEEMVARLAPFVGAPAIQRVSGDVFSVRGPDADAVLGALRCAVASDEGCAAMDVAPWIAPLQDVAEQAAHPRVASLLRHALPGQLLISTAARQRLVSPPDLQRLEPGPHGHTVWGLGPGVLLPAPPLALVLPSEPLVGHHDELQAIRAALGGGAGLVVLHGPAGTGKSALAAAAAMALRLTLHRDGGIHRARLEPGRVAADLATSVAGALGLGGRDPAHEVPRVLRGLGPSLLVIDGLEGLEESQVQELSLWRQVAPACAILLTARRPLRIQGAVQVRLDPLDDDVVRSALAARLLDRGGWDEPAALDALVSASAGSSLGVGLLVGLARRLDVPTLMRRLSALSQPEDDLSGSRLHQLVLLARSWMQPPLQRALDTLAALPGTFSLASAEAILHDADVDAVAAVDELVDRGLVRLLEDPVTGEARLELSSTVAEVSRQHLPRAVLERARQHHERWLAVRAATWVSHVESGFDETACFRRLHLARAPLRACLEHLQDPVLRLQVVRGLALLWEAGGLDATTLDAHFEGLSLGPDDEELALKAAMLRRDAGDAAGALERARPLATLPGPVGDAAFALLLEADPSLRHDPVVRRRLAGVVQRWSEHVSSAHLVASWEVLDVMLLYGFTGDAVDLAGRLQGVAADLGAAWRGAACGVLGWRGRVALGRLGERDIALVATDLHTLQRVGDHRRAGVALQWLARGLTAMEQPARALILLDRHAAYLERHAGWSQRRMLRIDRARASMLLGDLDGARAALERFRDENLEPTLPEALCDVELALVEIMAGRPAAASLHLDRVLDARRAPPAWARLAGLLQPVVDLMSGRRDVAKVRLQALRVSRPGARALHAFVTGWVGDAEPGVLVATARRHPEAHASTLWGAAIRALLVAHAQSRAPAEGQ